MTAYREKLGREEIEGFLRSHIFLHDATIDHVGWEAESREITLQVIGIYRLNEDRHFVPAESDITIYLTGADYESYAKLKALEEYDFVEFEFSSENSIKYCGRVMPPAIVRFEQIRAEKITPARKIDYLFQF